MPLLAYNLTGSPLTLAAGNHPPPLPASATPPSPGEAVNVTAELRGLSGGNYTSLQTQVTAGHVLFKWTGMPEYETGSLVIDAVKVYAQFGGGVVNVYISPSGTSNGLGTKASPWASPDDVYSNFPPFMFQNAVLNVDYQGPRVIVHCADSNGNFDDDLVYDAAAGQATYVMGGIWEFSSSIYNYDIFTFYGPRMVRATLTTGISIVPVGTVKTLSTPANTTKTRVTFGTSPSWTAHNLKGKFARFINTNTGNQIIFECPISDNAAATLDLDTTLVNTPLTADLAHMTVEICVPGAIFTGSAGDYGQFAVTGAGPSRGGLYWTDSTFRRIQIGLPAFAGFMLCTRGVGFDRCTIYGASMLGDGYGFFNCVVKSDDTGGQALGAFHGDSMSTIAFYIGAANGEPSQEDHDAGLELVVFQGFALGYYSTPSEGREATLRPSAYTAYRNVSVYDSGISGITIGPGSIFRTNVNQYYPNQATKVSIQGSNNASAGITCVGDGAQAVFDSPNGTAGLISITGAQADVQLMPELAGTPNGIRFGTGAGQFEEVTGWKGNYTHVLSATDATHVILGSSARICTRGYSY